MTTETSYPSDGVGGMTTAQWQHLYDAPDAIIEDTLGDGFSLAFVGDTVARISGPALGRVDGYVYSLTDTKDLTCPAGSAAKTYIVAIVYDPTLNVRQGSSDPNPNYAQPAGACRLIITDTALDTSVGQKYLPLFSWARAANQALSAVTVVDHRKWSGPNIEWPATMPEPPVGVDSFPRGTVRYDKTTGQQWLRTINAAKTGLEWQAFGLTTPIPFPCPSTLVAANTAPQYWFEGQRVYMRGTLARASGKSLTNGSDITVGTMPVGARPPDQVRFSCVAKPPSGWQSVQVTVRNDTGAVILYDPTDFECDYIDLSNISYRIGG